MRYTLLQNFGYGHEHFVDEIESESAKEAFCKMVEKHFDINKIERYTEFYVVTNDVSYSHFEKAFGFQSITGKHARTSTLKTIFNIQH